MVFRENEVACLPLDCDSAADYLECVSSHFGDAHQKVLISIHVPVERCLMPGGV